MATPQREWKHIQRKLRGIPVEQIAPDVAAMETNGMWCLVAGSLDFVLIDNSSCEVCIDDPLAYGQLVRYVQSHPERVHPSFESAQAFVRSRLGHNGSI